MHAFPHHIQGHAPKIITNIKGGKLHETIKAKDKMPHASCKDSPNASCNLSQALNAKIYPFTIHLCILKIGKEETQECL